MTYVNLYTMDDRNDRHAMGPLNSLPTYLLDSSRRVVFRFTAEQISATGFPVIVEGWEKCVGRSAGGRQRRAWEAEFTKAERRKASRLHTKLRCWYLRSGVPQQTLMGLQTYRFIQRLASFFGTL